MIKRKSQLGVGVVLSYIAQIVQIFITIFYTPVMLKFLGQSEYGIYQLAYSVVSYLSLFNFGFSSAYVKFYSECNVKENSDEEVANLNGIFMTVFAFLGTVVLVLGMFMAVNTEFVLGGKLSSDELNLAKVLMILMGINCSLNFPCTVFNNFIIAKEKFICLQGINLFSIIINPCMTFPMMLLGYKSISLAIALLVITIIKLIVSVYYCLRKLNMAFRFSHMRIRYVVDVAAFSGFIFIESVVSLINVSLDRFLLGKLVGSVAVAVYAVGGQINTLYTSLSTSISSVFSPRINKMVSEKCENNQLSKLFIKVGKIQFFILFMVLSGFLLFGKRFINIWAGSDYENAYYVAVILIVPNTINLIQNTAIEVQRAMGLQKYRSLTYAVIAVLNILISIFFIGKWQECGAALGTCLAWIIGSGFIMNWFYYYRVGLDIPRFWKEILCMMKGALIPLIYSFFVKKHIDDSSLVVYFMEIIVYAIIYLISMYYIGLSKEERAQIKLRGKCR